MVNALLSSGLASSRDRHLNSFFQDNLVIGDATRTGSPAIGRIVGGLCQSGVPTYANGDGVSFQFNTKGELKVDTELTVSGVEINNIKVYSTDGTVANTKYGKIDANGVVYINPWNGAQGAVVIDDTAQSGTPAFVNVGGEYRSSGTVYTDGDATVLQTDLNGYVKVNTSKSQATHDEAVVTRGDQSMFESKDFDGSTLPNAVTEGDAVRQAGSLNGVAYTMLTDGDGSDTPLVAESAAISAANGGTVGLMTMAEALSAQKSAITASDASRFVVNLNGELVLAAYIWATGKIGVTESDPLSSQYVDNAINVDTTNVGAGPTYYPSVNGLELDGSKNFSWTGKLIEGDAEDNTLTVEVMNDEDLSSGDWITTTYFYDLTTNTWVTSYGCNATTTLMAGCMDDINFSRVRFKFVGGGSATNTIIINGRTTAI